MISEFMYKQIKCKKSLAQCIDQFAIKTAHDITKISNSNTYISSLILV